MNVGAMRPDETGVDGCPQPNDVDRKRIERALADRQRYRYVSPSVRAVRGGYLVESPCCSRNVDPDGGVVDVALLQYVQELGAWQLHHRGHATQEWQLYATFERLAELLDVLNVDPERIFWR